MAEVDQLSGYGAELEELALRRKYAQMLREQSMQPLQGAGMAGRTVAPIHWTQGLAQMLKGAGGAMGESQVAQGRRGLADRATAERSSTLQQALSRARGGDQVSGAQALSASPFADLQGMGNKAMAPQFAPPEPYTLGAGAQRRGGNNEVVADNPQQFRPQTPPPASDLSRLIAEREALPPGDPRRATYDNAIRKKSETAAQIVPRITVNNPDPVTGAVARDPESPTGWSWFDQRTGRRTVQGAPPPGQSTEAVGFTGDKEKAKAGAKREFNMQGIGATIKEAEDILGGAAGKPLPTGSGIGTAVDFAGSLVGASPSGAKEADRLRAIGGALVAKMPRMEGPQSDKDVALYRESAGRVGDSTIPVERRKAALETVKGLWQKYENLNQDAFADRRSGGKPTLSPQEQSELDALRKRFGR